jgi:type III restriction enzyme
MVMVPYVQNAIATRKEADPAFDLWLFPGMELTCTGGKQGLILFDADLPQQWWTQAQGQLKIAHAQIDATAARAPKVTQLPCNYADIGDELDKVEGLKHRYIVVPNVSQGGQHTVLTDANHADFRRMPYVGGYLDCGQTIDTLGAKNRTRLSGSDPQWSEREIYPLPTSDSRSADYAQLGTNNTWIKLATPTAEAIRQAFLGHRSRICIEEPQTPALVAAAIKIQGAVILDDTALELSAELNAAIGGRGSGKSSFLEYLAFAFGRSCYDLARGHYTGSDRLSALINETLVSKNGSVSLRVIQDGAPFRVDRGPATQYQPKITYPNGSDQIITVKELRSLFPAIVYGQGELSEIGKQTGKRAQLSDLLQFVNPDYKREDDAFAADIETGKNASRAAITRLTTHWGLQSKLRKLTTERDSLRQRVTALEKSLPKLSDEDQAKIDYFDKATDFEAKRVQASKHADQIVDELAATARELSNRRDLTTSLSDDGKDIQERYDAFFQEFAKGIDKLQKDVTAKRSALSEAEQQWATKYQAAREARDGALEKLKEHKGVTAQIVKLREEAARLTNEIGDLDAQIKAQGDAASKLNSSIAALRGIVEQRAARTREWAKEIEQLSSGKIKTSVNPDGDISQIKEAIDYVASKTGSQEATRIRETEQALKSNALWDWLDRIRTDCLSLLYWQQLGAAAGEEKPKCEDLFTLAGDTEKIQTSLVEHMDSTRVEAITAAVPEPEIALFYCDGDRELSFEKASEGQRAAALLFMLLEQPGGPLIVDQPEGDLDNKVISDLTDKLHSAKKTRQLIFASHNANIVVNGASELVGHLEVRDDGKRQFDCAGAIDEPSICTLIADTMEGGEKAFRDRKDKYGY